MERFPIYPNKTNGKTQLLVPHRLIRQMTASSPRLSTADLGLAFSVPKIPGGSNANAHVGLRSEMGFP